MVGVFNVATVNLQGEDEARLLLGKILHVLGSEAASPKDAVNVAMNLYLIATKNLGVSDEDAERMIVSSIKARSDFYAATVTPQ